MFYLLVLLSLTLDNHPESKLLYRPVSVLGTTYYCSFVNTQLNRGSVFYNFRAH